MRVSGAPSAGIRQAVVLVGGLGTRLRSLGLNCPKPMVTVAGRPFVEHVVSHLASYGVNRIVLVAGFLGEQIRERYDRTSLGGVRLGVVVEPSPQGTGGALAMVDDLDEEFVVANGDSIFLTDLAEFVTSGLSGAKGRLLLREVEDASRYGSVTLDADNRVATYAEKSPERMGRPGLISAGLYRLSREALRASVKGPCSIEQDVFPVWAASGDLEGQVGEGYFVDIGVPESLRSADAEIGPLLTRPAAFLDRDGVINVDHGYTVQIEDLVFTPTAVTAIRRLNHSGFRVIVVSNQAGIARGYYDEHDVEKFHLAMQDRLLAAGAHIDAFYIAPYHPDGTIARYAVHHEDRKPGVGMIRKALSDWPTDLRRSFLVGDKPSDLEAAASAGLPGHGIAKNLGDLDALVSQILTANNA